MSLQNTLFQNPQATGAPEVFFPLPMESPTHYQVTQRMVVLSKHYEGPPLDAPHHMYPKSYCVRDENHTLVGPIQQFDRVFMTVPVSVTVLDVDSVTYPPIGPTTGATSFQLKESGGLVTQHYGDIIPRTAELTITVPVRRHREYFIPGVVGGYASVDEVPLQLAFTITDSNGIPLADTETATAQPDATEYARYVKAGLSLVVEPTLLARYAGNIWYTQTTTALAR